MDELNIESGIYEKLKNCTSREGVRAAFFGFAGLSFPPKQKFDSTEQVLYIFCKERRFLPPRGIAFPLAQALYILRELKYGEVACPIPPYVCAVCRGEAFLAETRPFAKFYARRESEKYDWDRAALSPCPKLVSALDSSPLLARIRVYRLKEPVEEAAFFAALARVRVVQLSMFGREKKTIDENNFLKVYEYWASLFAESLSENGEARKLAEYFLSDIEDRKTPRSGAGAKAGKSGRTEFFFGRERVIKSLPVYEYTYFWSLYERVKDEKTIFAIRRKIDRLSEDFARRFQGEFYTPVAFAAKAYEYIEKTVGKRKLESGEYRIWDMAAGSGNLEFTLPVAALPYTYISTLNEDDANYCRRIFPSSKVFQYDYLNDDVDEIFRRDTRGRDERKGRQKNSAPDGAAEGRGTAVDAETGAVGAVKSVGAADAAADVAGGHATESVGAKKAETEKLKMPEDLKRDLQNPRLKWLIFINPPFATSNRLSLSAGKESKRGVSDTKIRRIMLEEGIGETGRELFSQFLFRISREFRGKKAYLGLFSTLKYLNAPNDRKLRGGFFRYTAERGFLFSSENFEGSKGRFPVGFIVWNMRKETPLERQTLVLDVFNREAEKVGVKRIWTDGGRKLLSAWTDRPPTTHVFPPFTGGAKVCEGHVDVRDRVADGFLCSLMCCGNDFQHQNQTAILSGPQASAGSYSVTAENFEKSMTVHAVRKLPKASWSNNRDQFYSPVEEPSEQFFADCVVWSAFADSNNTCSLKEVVYKGRGYRVRNELFPFSRAETAEWAKAGGGAAGLADFGLPDEGESYLYKWLNKRLNGKILSEEAVGVMREARAFYAYCFRTGKADIWDEGYLHLRTAAEKDEGGRVLLNVLKRAHKALGEKLLPQVYGYGFVPADVEYFGKDE